MNHRNPRSINCEGGDGRVCLHWNAGSFWALERPVDGAGLDASAEGTGNGLYLQTRAPYGGDTSPLEPASQLEFGDGAAHGGG